MKRLMSMWTKSTRVTLKAQMRVKTPRIRHTIKMLSVIAHFQLVLAVTMTKNPYMMKHNKITALIMAQKNQASS